MLLHLCHSTLLLLLLPPATRPLLLYVPRT
jgi:hypothetical protein